MKRTPLAVTAVRNNSHQGRANPDVARQMQDIAAQYGRTGAAFILLSAETTRLAAASSLRATSGAESSRSQSAELRAIVSEINATLSAAIEPVKTATMALEKLSQDALREPVTVAGSMSRATLVRECASVMQSLGDAMARMDEA
jgi:hypothetical protein